MTNLYVFDKDETLVHPLKDGYVGHPEDQVLYEGVRAKLDRLRSEGHVLAIASNQGGCDYHEVKASCVQSGNYLRHGSDSYLVEQINTHGDGIYFQYDRPRPGGKSHSFAFPDSEVKVSYKTIESAIAEVQFAADLCGITEAAFCPVMDGSTMRSMMSIGGVWGSCPITVAGFNEVFRCVVNFRKPHGGMLIHAQKTGTRTHFDRLIMVGDRDSDREAAISAGFEFMWAEDWRNG